MQFIDVSFSYREGEPVLRGISFRIRRRELVIMLGRSGSGKTTLLKLAKGLLSPTSGQVVLLGESVRSNQRGGHSDVAYIPQQLGLVRGASVLSNVLTGCLGRVGTVRSLLGWFPSQEVRRAYSVMEELGISHKAKEKVWALSGGERQRVAIARALMQRPKLILADEFVSQLDAVTARSIMEIVSRISKSGVAVLMATHDIDLVHFYAHRVLVLREGSKAAEVEPSAVSPEVLYTWIKG